MKFLRNLLAAILGCLLAFGIVFFMFLIFVSIAGVDEGLVVKENSVLVLEIPEPVKDYTGNTDDDPFALFAEPSQGLNEIVNAIAVAAEDDDIKGISITGNFLAAGMSQTEAIRMALEDFKESGKFVYAYNDLLLQKDYYLASVADTIFLHPQAILDFRGLAAEVLYFKEFQEKSGLKMEVVRHGKYKSAVEPFLLDEMSEENREQISSLLNSVWASMVDDISTSRGITAADLNNIADTLGGRQPEYALESGLVDVLGYFGEYDTFIKGRTGVDADEEQPYVELQKYLRKSNKKSIYKGSDKVAVIYAQGEIFYGEGGPDFIGQGLMREAIKKARESDKVKAVVLRINSPGGNALTSDIIWKEIEELRKVKPVVVSMGDVAASGGYYIAVGADKIFAQPTTITGSIGVFGTIPNVSGVAGDIGINAEQVGTNRNAIGYSVFEPMSEDFREVVAEGIEATYHTFLQRVADGRNMSMARADSLAQGRVYSGTRAVELGLVDEMGGLHDAVKAAAELAELEEFGLRNYPKYRSGFERLLEDMGGAKTREFDAEIARELGPELYGVFKDLKGMVKQEGIQARMPFTLNIR